MDPDPLSEFSVGPVQVMVRQGCTRRDQYDVRVPGGFPPAVVEKLRSLGPCSGTDLLFTVEVERKHQLTVAPTRGRLLIVPRMTLGREEQRSHALFVIDLIAQQLGKTAYPRDLFSQYKGPRFVKPNALRDKDRLMESTETTPAANRQQVRGIGGVFLKAKDPQKLRAFYENVLGVPFESFGASVFRWADRAAPENAATVFSFFPGDTTYFAPSEKPFMVNFVVDDLEAMLQQARNSGALVEDKIQTEPYGKFGWLLDPEGNRVELWQPL